MITLLSLLLPLMSFAGPLPVELKDEKGLVVVFLSIKCPCSQSHHSELKKLSEEFKDFKFVGIHSNSDEDKNLSKEFFKNADFSFPVLQDDHQKYADQFKALKTPHAFILNPKGDILYQGGVSNSSNFDRATRKFLREALTDLSQQKKIKTPEGRTLGCIISREDQKNVW